VADKENKPKIPMEHHNMAEFLRGQSSKILTRLSKEDKTAFIQKNGKPIVIVISNDRYERMLKEGVDINDY
jgi:PHD/YefM family antitoxin component YafN of YafNO toxin-antitoxin module